MVEKKLLGRSKAKVIEKKTAKKEGTKKPETIKMSSDPETEMREPRMNVGARNPFIIAKIKLEQDGQDTSHLQPADLRKMMETAFDGLKYSQLFDPKYGSPVYCGLYFATLKYAEICPKKYSQSLSLLLRDPAREVGAAPCYCPSTMDPPSGTVYGRNLKYTIYKYKNNGLEFNDTAQGCLADCWLIAALSSLAWAETNGFTKKLKRSTTLSPTLAVWPIPIWHNCACVSTSSEFYLDRNFRHPYYAHLNSTMDKSDDYECWMAYYEKCFASFYEQIEEGSGPHPNGGACGCRYYFDIENTPTYSYLNYKSPFKAMKELTGLLNTEKYTVDYFAGTGAAGIIDDIRRYACGNVALNDGSLIPTKRPATAYTYLSADEVPPVANNQGFPAVTYNRPGIPANHAFSILGLYQNAGAQYVVLRNPWAYIDCDPNPAVEYGTNTFNADVLSNVVSIARQFANATYIASFPSEAIFALKNTCFIRYFEAFGWSNQ